MVSSAGNLYNHAIGGLFSSLLLRCGRHFITNEPELTLWLLLKEVAMKMVGLHTHFASCYVCLYCLCFLFFFLSFTLNVVNINYIIWCKMSL